MSADRSSSVPAAGTLIYDADCGFCTECADWLSRHGECALQPWQSADLSALGLTEEEVRLAAYWLDESGQVAARGPAAIAEALKSCRRGWRLVGRAMDLGPLRPVAGRVYAWVARNRHRLPGSTEACRMPPRR